MSKCNQSRYIGFPNIEQRASIKANYLASVNKFKLLEQNKTAQKIISASKHSISIYDKLIRSIQQFQELEKTHTKLFSSGHEINNSKYSKKQMKILSESNTESDTESDIEPAETFADEILVLHHKYDFDFGLIDFDVCEHNLSAQDEKGYNHKHCVPIEEIETDWDEILIPDGDCFRIKEIKFNVQKHIISNIDIINKFPNALLIEDNLFTESDSVANTKSKTNPATQSSLKDSSANTPNTNINTNTDTGADLDSIWAFVEEINKDSKDIPLDDIVCSTENGSEDEQTDSDTESETEFSDREDQYKPDDADQLAINSRLGTKFKCASCDSTKQIIEEATGHVICEACGMVNDELMDHSPEWKQYYNDDSRGAGMNRCACPTNFFFPKSSQGTIMSGSNYNRLKRKLKWGSMVYKERSLNYVIEKITNICTKNNLQQIIIDSAKIIYNKLSNSKHKSGKNVGKPIIIRGCNRNSIIAACVFFSCVMNENPLKVKEIAKMFGLDVKRVTKGCKQLFKLMKNCDDNFFFDQLDTSTPEHYIKRYCPKLKISKINTELTIKIARNCGRLKLVSDHNPHSIAAGCIMVMIKYRDLNIDKEQLASIFKTSVVTISKIYNKICMFTDAMVDDDATSHLVKVFGISK